MSLVTPELANRDGEQILRIGLRSNRVDVSGEITGNMEGSNIVFEWTIGKRLNHSFVTMEGVYSPQIAAADFELDLIELKVSGGFREPSSE